MDQCFDLEMLKPLFRDYGIINETEMFNICEKYWQNSPDEIKDYLNTAQGRAALIKIHLQYNWSSLSRGYRFNENDVLIIRSRNDLERYCDANSIPITEFNQPVVIEDGVKDCSELFKGLKAFNQMITIPDSAVKCSHMFEGCESFNQPIVIPSGVTSCYGMLSKCRSFNQPVVIPSSVTNCGDLFNGCTEFNQHIIIPEGVKTCCGMFAYCDKFNQPVIIPAGVTNCANMFTGCPIFNQPIAIPSSIKNCIHMFYDCKCFNQYVTIPKTAVDYWGAFGGCPGTYNNETMTYTPETSSNESMPSETFVMQDLYAALSNHGVQDKTKMTAIIENTWQSLPECVKDNCNTPEERTKAMIEYLPYYIN